MGEVNRHLSGIELLIESRFAFARVSQLSLDVVIVAGLEPSKIEEDDGKKRRGEQRRAEGGSGRRRKRDPSWWWSNFLIGSGIVCHSLGMVGSDMELRKPRLLTFKVARLNR